MWEGKDDTPRLIDELTQAIRGKALPDKPTPVPRAETSELPPPTPVAQPRKFDPTKLDSPEGTIAPDSKFYIERTNAD